MNNSMIEVIELTEQELAVVAGGSGYVIGAYRTEPADSDRAGYLSGGH